MTLKWHLSSQLRADAPPKQRRELVARPRVTSSTGGLPEGTKPLGSRLLYRHGKLDLAERAFLRRAPLGWTRADDSGDATTRSRRSET